MSLALDRLTGAEVRRPVVLGIAGKAAELVTLLLLAVLVPRILGPGPYGEFAVALTVVTLGSLALTLGGPTLLSRYVPAAPPADRPGLARALTVRLARGRGAQLAVLSAAAVGLSAADPATFPPLVTLFVMAALALNVAATLALQLGLGLGRTAAWSMRFPLQNAVLVAAVLLLHGGSDGTGAVAAILVSAVVACGLGVATALPVLRRRPPPVPLPVGALRFGAVAAAGGAVSQVAHRGGIIAVAVLAGSAVQTGYAALAIGVALAAMYAVVQLFTVSLPGLAARRGAEAAAAETVLRRLAGGLLAAVLPGALLLAPVLDRVVPLVFGPQYAPAAPAFGPALAVVVLAPLYAMAVQVAALRLRPTATLHSALAGLATVAVVAVGAVPAWGALGATAATAAGAAVSAAVAMWALPRAFGAPLGAASLGGAGVVAAVATVV